VSRSTDGGATFGDPVVAYSLPNNEIFPDKNWMAINSFPGTPTAGRIVVTFTSFSNTGSTARPIARVLSDDRGATWSSLAIINNPTAQCQGSQPVFLRDGLLAVSYWNFNRTATNADDFIELVISNDGGNTFTAPKFVSSVAIYNHPLIRDAVVLPSMTTDRTTGNLYLVYQATHGGSPRIMFTKSTNRGDSWTPPIPISNNPAGSAVLNPATLRSPDGQTLSVSFYDARDNPGSQTHLDMYLAQSFDGGATWQPNIRLTSESTNAALAPMSGTDPNNPQYMLGDYQGIAESTGPNVPAVPLWIDTRTGNPDPYVTRIGMAPTVNFTAWQAARLSLGQINDPQSGGEAGDADRDGEDNLSEYRSGTEPNDPFSVFRTGRLVNISTRGRVLTGENILIGGFIITGSDAKEVAIRAIGPSTASAGVADPLQDPMLEVFNRDGFTIATNDNWKETQQAALENSALREIERRRRDQHPDAERNQRPRDPERLLVMHDKHLAPISRAHLVIAAVVHRHRASHVAFSHAAFVHSISAPGLGVRVGGRIHSRHWWRQDLGVVRYDLAGHSGGADGAQQFRCLDGLVLHRHAARFRLDLDVLHLGQCADCFSMWVVPPNDGASLSWICVVPLATVAWAQAA
jgi:hypothetical protein